MTVVYIWIRAGLPWDDEEAAMAELRPDLQYHAAAWNETFNISYQRFRHRVSEIARENRSRVQGAKTATWDEIPENALVMPVDDDDWFAPDAAETLKTEHDPRARVYLWPSRWVEVPLHLGHRFHLFRRRLLPWTPPRFVCTTNNYAMVKDGETRPLLGDHAVASEWVKPRLKAGKTIRRIDRELSVANRTLGSQTTLMAVNRNRPARRKDLLRRFGAYRRLYEQPLSEPPQWAQPYLEQMKSLMAELRPR